MDPHLKLLQKVPWLQMPNFRGISEKPPRLDQLPNSIHLLLPFAAHLFPSFNSVFSPLWARLPVSVADGQLYLPVFSFEKLISWQWWPSVSACLDPVKQQSTGLFRFAVTMADVLTGYLVGHDVRLNVLLLWFRGTIRMMTEVPIVFQQLITGSYLHQFSSF